MIEYLIDQLAYDAFWIPFLKIQKQRTVIRGQKTSWSSQKDCQQDAPTPPCLALYLTYLKKKVWGYEEWETLQEV